MPTTVAEFLRARRAEVRPSEVGLPGHGLRRVAGLRREEVAVLASVSVDYYTRLEQGREAHPSVEVLEALARTLGLDDDARLHLFRLGGHVTGPDERAGRQPVSPELLRLMDRWRETPAIVVDRTLDVLAGNPIGLALFEDFAQPGNLVRMVFLDPVARRFYADWDPVAERTVASLRVAAGIDPDDPRLRALVAELEDASPPFRELWAKQQVRGKGRESKRLRHGAVGELTLSYQAFGVRSAPGQELLVYEAEPGTVSAENLALLGTLVATRAGEARAPRHVSGSTPNGS